MKKILVIVLMFVTTVLPAQDKMDRLIEQQAKQGEQIAELVRQMSENNKLMLELTKQQAVTSTKVDSLEKSTEKRFDTQSNLILCLIAFIAALVGAIFWDRRSTLKPFEIKVVELEKEVKELKEKDVKHEEKEKKAEIFFKRLIEKYPDLANS